MERRKISADERIVRAIRSSDWDEANQRYSSNLFTGPETSVSRLSILKLPILFKIFCRDLHKPPKHKVQSVGIVTVESVVQAGENFVNNGRPDRRTISVVEDPLRKTSEHGCNPAHALVLEKLPRTLAHELISKLEIQPASACPQGALRRVADALTILIMCLVRRNPR